MQLHQLMVLLDEMAPLAYAEDFDNTGLLVGNPQQSVDKILVTLDTLESVVDEAIAKQCNCIVSFHPIIFSGLKKLTGRTYVERAVLKAIKNDIAIYAIHTALDNHWEGVNAKICAQLELTDRQILIPKTDSIKKLVTFVPENKIEDVRNALFEAGAGNIGNYSHCSFNSTGLGSFRPEENSNPTTGQHGHTSFEQETRLGITFHKHREKAVMKALFESHPYDEVAYEVTTLENINQQLGMGMIAQLPDAMQEENFFNYLKEKMNVSVIRHSALRDKPVKKIAVLGGSGAFAIGAAKAKGADVFISADFKYHDFFQAEDSIVLADIGHYESEQFTKDLIVTTLTKKITNFAPALEKPEVLISEINSNPISYF